MTCKMFDEDLNEIIAGKKFHHFDRDEGYRVKEKNISKQYGRFNFKETHLKEISICYCEYDINNNLKLYGKIKGEMLCLSFMNRGSSCFTCGSIKNCILPQNTYNLFYMEGEYNTIKHLNKGRKNEVLDIIISKEYIMNMYERYPGIFEPFYENIKRNKNFSFYEKGIFIRPDIYKTVQDIKEAYLLGKTAPLYIEAKTQELFALLLGRTNKNRCDNISCAVREKIYEAKHIIEANYNAPPGIQELALMVGVSSTTMKTCFKKIFHNTVYGYLFDYRMKKAEQLLETPDLNISEVAELTGYEHPAHFCTAFKRKFGITPMEYKKKST